MLTVISPYLQVITHYQLSYKSVIITKTLQIPALRLGGLGTQLGMPGNMTTYYFFVSLAVCDYTFSSHQNIQINLRNKFIFTYFST